MATRCWWNWAQARHSGAPARAGFARAGVADDGRAEGRILRVLTRGNPTVVGTFHYGLRQNYVQPIDEKITKQIIIPRGMEWPASRSRTAIRDWASRPMAAEECTGETIRRRSQAASGF